VVQHEAVDTQPRLLGQNERTRECALLAGTTSIVRKSVPSGSRTTSFRGPVSHPVGLSDRLTEDSLEIDGLLRPVCRPLVYRYARYFRPAEYSRLTLM